MIHTEVKANDSNCSKEEGKNSDKMIAALARLWLQNVISENKENQ